MTFPYETLNALEENANLIVLGTPVSQENHVVFDAEGFTQEAYTIDNGIKPGSTQFSIEGYKLMEQGKQYVLVLRPDQTDPDLHVIVGLRDGKYSLEEDSTVEKIGKFRDELFKKYDIQ